MGRTIRAPYRLNPFLARSDQQGQLNLEFNVVCFFYHRLITPGKVERMSRVQNMARWGEYYRLFDVVSYDESFENTTANRVQII